MHVSEVLRLVKKEVGQIIIAVNKHLILEKGIMSSSDSRRWIHFNYLGSRFSIETEFNSLDYHYKIHTFLRFSYDGNYSNIERTEKILVPNLSTSIIFDENTNALLYMIDKQK
jgi:hypothetical protein